MWRNRRVCNVIENRRSLTAPAGEVSNLQTERGYFEQEQERSRNDINYG
jgi:hypothetical protein